MTFVFHAKLGSNGDSCAVVTVKKFYTPVGAVNKLKTTIDSRGYNTGWKAAAGAASGTTGTCDLPSAKRVERGLSFASF